MPQAFILPSGKASTRELQVQILGCYPYTYVNTSPRQFYRLDMRKVAALSVSRYRTIWLNFRKAQKAGGEFDRIEGCHFAP